MEALLRPLAPGDSLEAISELLHLRARYARLGYAEADRVQWDGKRYCSLILVKPLAGALPTADDPEHRDAPALAA